MKLGIDLGGTKIEVAALNDEGTIVFRERRPTPKGKYKETLETIADLCSICDTKAGTKGLPIGIGTPGVISKSSGLLKNSNSRCLIGKPLLKDLENLLQRKVRLANDANCFALSEAVDGAGKGFDVVFGVILGTGVGGGIVAHGKILEGPNGIAGEWGHNPLPWMTATEFPGPGCYCGRKGCVETFLSGPALEGFQKTKSKTQALEDFNDQLSRALASVINVLDPDVIVMGGGVSNLEPIYKEVPKLWNRYVFSDHVETKFVRAQHGDSSGVRGAAWLF